MSIDIVCMQVSVDRNQITWYFHPPAQSCDEVCKAPEKCAGFHFWRVWKSWMTFLLMTLVVLMKLCLDFKFVPTISTDVRNATVLTFGGCSTGTSPNNAFGSNFINNNLNQTSWWQLAMK
jgi:hypothetical protein